MSKIITTQYHCDCCDVFEQFDSPSAAYKYGTVRRTIIEVSNRIYSADLCPDCRADFERSLKTIIKKFNMEEE